MDRASRTKCWEGRDDFFKCLDKHDIVDPIKDAPKANASCSTEKLSFEANCVATWVEYFSKKRVLEMQREAMIKEAVKRGANILSADDVRHPAGRRDSA